MNKDDKEAYMEWDDDSGFRCLVLYDEIRGMSPEAILHKGEEIGFLAGRESLKQELADYKEVFESDKGVKK